LFDFFKIVFSFILPKRNLSVEQFQLMIHGFVLIKIPESSNTIEERNQTHPMVLQYSTKLHSQQTTKVWQH